MFITKWGFQSKRNCVLKAIRKWDKGLVDCHSDLLALASFTAAAEKANQIMAAGIKNTFLTAHYTLFRQRCGIWRLSHYGCKQRQDDGCSVQRSDLSPQEDWLWPSCYWQKSWVTWLLCIFDPSKIFSLKTWPTEPVEMFFLFQLKFHHHFIFFSKWYTKNICDISNVRLIFLPTTITNYLCNDANVVYGNRRPKTKRL